jgi:hypothetical protein
MSRHVGTIVALRRRPGAFPDRTEWLSSEYPLSSGQNQAVAIGHPAAARVIVEKGHDASHGATGDRSPRLGRSSKGRSDGHD